MTSDLPRTAGPSPQTPPTPGRSGWVGSFALGGLIFAVYLANGREIGTDDTEAATLMSIGLSRGEGIYLDRFFGARGSVPGGPLQDNVRRSRGHVVSRHPIATALLAWPAMALQFAFFDRVEPGWDGNGIGFYRHVSAMVKRVAALIAALTAVVLHRVLRGLGLGRGRVAVPAVLASALGSDLWTVAGQALWQHGPAALAIISAAWLLLPREAARWRVALAGLAVAALVAFRAVDVVFAAAISARVARCQPRRLGWFVPAPLLGASALIGYNLWFFGSIAGGQPEMEAFHPKIHAMPAGPWSGDLLAGMAGTLLSPSRGLLVFSPWVAPALAALPFSARRIARWPVVTWLLVALVPFGLILSKYTVWWGGHCFGPRYWTEAMPLLAIALAFGLDWSYERCRPVAMAFLLAIAVAIAVQAIGAFYFPSSWAFLPDNVDLHHERLWDWRDCELTRCLHEKAAR